jgi:hypothetical protein
MSKLLINIDPALKERLRSVSVTRGESMAKVARTAIDEFTKDSVNHDPPYTVPMRVEGRPSVEDLHLFVDVMHHYVSEANDDVDVGAVAQTFRDGFKVDVDYEYSGHHLFACLVRTEADFEQPLFLGLFQKMSVRALPDFTRVEFKHLRFNPSMSRLPEAEIGAGAALILLSVPKDWQDGRDCAALILMDPQHIEGTYAFPSASQPMPWMDAVADFKSGTVVRVRNGERLADKLAEYKSSWLSLMPGGGDDA